MKNYLTKPITEDKIKLRTGTLDGARELTKSISDVYTRLENDAKNRNLKLSSDDTLKTQRLLNTAGYTDLQGKKLKEDAILGDKTKVAAEKYFQSGIPKADVMNMQKQLNKNGITDRLGKALIVDGKLGPKTDGAVHEHLGKKRYTKEKDNNPMVKLPYYPGETKHEISEPVWRGKPEDIEVNLLSGKNTPTGKSAAGVGMPWEFSPNGPTVNSQNKWDAIRDIEQITKNTQMEKFSAEVPSFMKENDDSLLKEMPGLKGRTGLENKIYKSTNPESLRYRVESLGGTVKWNDSTKKATVNINGYEEEFYVGDGNGTFINDGVMYTDKLHLDNILYAPTNSAAKFFYDRITDDFGKFILRKWLNGDGSETVVASDRWTAFIKNNKFFKDRVCKLVLNGIQAGETEVSETSGLNLTGSSGGITNGYELINGANEDVGGCNISAKLFPTNDGYDIEISFNFNDKIDPNYTYREDRIFALGAKIFGAEAKDYILRINGKFKIKYKNGVLIYD